MSRVILLLALFLTSQAFARNVSLYNGDRNDCFYNGEKYDDRYDAPQHFTGEYSCRDSDTHKLVLVEHYIDGKRDGAYAKFDYQTGTLEEEGRNKNGKTEGVMKRYQNGKLQIEFSYVNGELSGVQKDYADGILSRVFLIVGKSERDTEFSLNKKGQLTQLTCGRQAISAKDAAWCGRDGKLSTITLYDDQGQVRATQQYLWGLQSGVEKTFHTKTGQLLSEDHYEKGKLVQESAGFDKSGALKYKSDCDPARKNCTDTEYFEGGKETRHVVRWIDGKKSRDTDYYQNGKISRDILAQGSKYKITEYSDFGNKTSQGIYIESSDWYWNSYVPDGMVEYYNEDGSVSRRENYVTGRREGKSEVFWVIEGHKIHEESEYDKDVLKSTKISIDGQIYSQAEYLPDGSIKEYRKFSKLPNGVSI